MEMRINARLQGEHIHTTRIFRHNSNWNLFKNILVNVCIRKLCADFCHFFYLVLTCSFCVSSM